MAQIERTPVLLRHAPAERLMTAIDVAAYLNISPQTVYALAANGQIPSFKIRATRRFRRQDIDAYIGLCTNSKEVNQDDSRAVD